MVNLQFSNFLVNPICIMPCYSLKSLIKPHNKGLDTRSRTQILLGTAAHRDRLQNPLKFHSPLDFKGKSLCKNWLEIK